MSLFLLFEDSSEESVVSSATDSDFQSDKNNSKSSSSRHLYAKIVIENEKPISGKTKIAWSLVLIIMASFFLAAAYVQHNDPDPYVWMPAYLVPSFINLALTVFALCPATKCSMLFWKTINWIITIHICYCYALGFWTLTHYIHRRVWGNDSGNHIMAKMVSEPDMYAEEAKELIGLCLVVAWLSFVSNGNFLRFGMKGIVFGCLLTLLPIVSWVIVESFEGNREETTCF